MENEQLPAPPPASSAGGTATTPSSTGTARPPAPQISVYSGIPDRQTVQVPNLRGWGLEVVGVAFWSWGAAQGRVCTPQKVIQQALHRQPNTAAQYLQQMYAAQQQHLMLQTAALQQQHLTSAQLQSLAAVQQVRRAPPGGHPWVLRCGMRVTLGSCPQASLAANRQSGSSGGNGAQPAPAQQPTVSPACPFRHLSRRHPSAAAPQPSPPVPLQINLATSPAAAQLLNRAQSVTPGASGIAQQAVLLGNAASPALTASQAQMYLRAQMVRGRRRAWRPAPWRCGVVGTGGVPFNLLWGGQDL